MEEKDHQHFLDRARATVPADTFNRQRFEVPVLDVIKEGSTTLIRNLASVAKYLNRDPLELLKFILSELATSGSMDGHRALLKGDFPAKKINYVLPRYVDTYVICPTCKKPDTRVEKDGRKQVLVCQACGSRNPIRGKS